MDSPEVKNFFQSLGVTPNEVKHLFELLDDDGRGGIDVQEFLGGSIRLQMPPKYIDLMMNGTRHEKKMTELVTQKSVPARQNSDPASPASIERLYEADPRSFT